MTEQLALVRALEDADISFERLYRIEIERAVAAPPVCAPEPPDPVGRRLNSLRVGRRPEQHHKCVSWETAGLLYDLHDRTLPQILDEIEALLDGHSGLWRFTVYYWSGAMRTPTPQRHMGDGENFLYSPNPHGDLVLKLEPPIEIDLGDEE